MQNRLSFRVRAATVWFVAVASIPATAANPVTFNKDVLPILQRNCQGCHRPGEIAPMSFITYSETRPWAKTIKLAVVSKKMPPWFADEGPSMHFKNEGAAKDKLAPIHFAEGWSIGKPDMIAEDPREMSLPFTGFMDQANMLVRVNFPRDARI